MDGGGIEGDDHAFATLATGYAVACCALACVVSTLSRAKGAPGWSVTEQLLVFLAATGVAFGALAVVHTLFGVYAQDGVAKGVAWSQPNSSWMYAMLGALLCTGPAGSAMLALALAAWPSHRFVGALVYFVGFSVSVYDAYDFGASENMGAGVAGCTWHALCALIATAVMMAGSRQPFVTLGLVCSVVGWSLEFYFSPSCTLDASLPQWERQGLRECPFPEEFSQDAVFQLFVLASVALITTGVWQMDRNDNYGFLLPDGRVAVRGSA